MCVVMKIQDTIDSNSVKKYGINDTGTYQAIRNDFYCKMFWMD